MDIVEDILSNMEVTESREGFSAVRTFIATEVYVIEDLLRQLPQIGQPYPHTTLKLFVSSRNISAMGEPTTWRAVVNYAPATVEENKTVVNISGSVNEVETNKDSDGVVFDALSSKQDKYKLISPYIPTVRKLAPGLTIQITKRVLGIAAVLSDASGLVGKIGTKANFVWRTGDEWLCTRVSASSPDGGSNYDVTYEFQFNPDGWVQDVFLKDPNTGAPIENPSIEDGSMASVEVYKSTKFPDFTLPQ